MEKTSGVNVPLALARVGIRITSKRKLSEPVKPDLYKN